MFFVHILYLKKIQVGFTFLWMLFFINCQLFNVVLRSNKGNRFVLFSVIEDPNDPSAAGDVTSGILEK